MGVFVHVWDGTEQPSADWLPGDRSNQRCHTLDEEKRHVPKQCDRLPTTLLYQGMPYSHNNGTIALPLGQGTRGGLILRPTSDQIRCAYPVDGGTRWLPDGCACPRVARNSTRECVAGAWATCGAAHQERVSALLHKVGGAVGGARTAATDKLLIDAMHCPSGPTGRGRRRLAWAAPDLELMLRLTRAVGGEAWRRNHEPPYNEFVVSPTSWNASEEQQAADWAASAPRLVGAVFYPASHAGPCCSDGQNAADAGRGCAANCGAMERRVHAQLLAAFGVSSAQLPLVVLRRHRWDAPFASDASAGGSGRATGPVSRTAGHHAKSQRGGIAIARDGA